MQTYEKYKGLIKNHIEPKLGNFNLQDLTADVLQGFVVELCGFLSSNSVNGIISVIKQSLKTTTNIGIINVNFSVAIKRPRQEEKQIEIFTKEEQRRIEKYILTKERERYFGIFLCLYTGLRIGELLALEWSDIDFKRGLIYVRKSCHFGKNYNGEYGRIVDKPKTISSIRIVPIPKAIFPYIKEIKQTSISTFVISKNGKFVTTRSYQNAFSLLLK